jgi:thiosulfate dehydrogenase
MRAVEAAFNMGRKLLVVIVILILIPVAVLVWLKFGKVPVAVADKPFPQERLIVHIPLEARIQRELVKTPPVQADEDSFVAGAHIYSDRCAVCHGLHGKPSTIGVHMYPDAPALWQKHPNSDVVGVSDDPPAETYWKVINGIRLTGMPSYKQILSEKEAWQVSLLLANADKPLPSTAVDILLGETPIIPPNIQLPTPVATPAKTK